MYFGGAQSTSGRTWHDHQLEGAGHKTDMMHCTFYTALNILLTGSMSIAERVAISNREETFGLICNLWEITLCGIRDDS